MKRAIRHLVLPVVLAAVTLIAVVPAGASTRSSRHLAAVATALSVAAYAEEIAMTQHHPLRGDAVITAAAANPDVKLGFFTISFTPSGAAEVWIRLRVTVRPDVFTVCVAVPRAAPNVAHVVKCTQ
jgi:hypothetical protein